MQDGHLTVCVVGGGFTGAAVAVACLSHLKSPFRLVMIEGTSSLGRGLAYGSHHPLNLLNVRTRDLSIRAGQPGDFLNWAFRQLDQGENQAGLHEALAHTFLPRQLFGEYVRQRLFDSVARRPVAFTVITAAARGVSSENEQYRIDLDKTEPVTADVVILATAYGLQQPRSQGALAPFEIISAERTAAASSMVLIGSGQTMVDVLLGGRRDGFQGKAIRLAPRSAAAHARAERRRAAAGGNPALETSLFACGINSHRLRNSREQRHAVASDHQWAATFGAKHMVGIAARGAGAFLAPPSPVLGRASPPLSHRSTSRVQRRTRHIATRHGEKGHSQR